MPEDFLWHVLEGGLGSFFGALAFAVLAAIVAWGTKLFGKIRDLWRLLRKLLEMDPARVSAIMADLPKDASTTQQTVSVPGKRTGKNGYGKSGRTS